MTHKVVFDDRIPEAVRDALNDSARICPMLAAPGLLQGNTLRLRLPEGELFIQAPARLLKKVFALCDGTRSLATLIDSVDEALRDEWQRFLDFLLAEGALIDAVLYTRRAGALCA
ncbi:MAG: hypothetical protein RIR70_702, partial [Pseudomonadota bacterium]